MALCAYAAGLRIYANHPYRSIAAARRLLLCDEVPDVALLTTKLE